MWVLMIFYKSKSLQSFEIVQTVRSAFSQSCLYLAEALFKPDINSQITWVANLIKLNRLRAYRQIYMGTIPESTTKSMFFF